MAKTLKEFQREHDAAVESNRAMGVIDYGNGETQSDQVWEVQEGKVHLPYRDTSGRAQRKVIGPGHRFHPTADQLERMKKANGKGGLSGKARELTQTEYAGVRSGRITSRGADIGLRQFKMAEGTLKYALDHGLTEADFANETPAGTDGRYTLIQVEAMVAAAAQAA